MPQKLKRQTIELKLAAGTAAGKHAFREKLDAQFNKAVGYVAYEHLVTPVPYRLEVKDDQDTYQQMTSSQDYVATRDCPKEGRYTPCDIAARTNYVTVTVELSAALAAEMHTDFVFLLQN